MISIIIAKRRKKLPERLNNNYLDFVVVLFGSCPGADKSWTILWPANHYLINVHHFRVCINYVEFEAKFALQTANFIRISVHA